MAEGRILVLDNDPQIRRMMRTTLIAQGFEISDARTGIEAVERMHSDKFDLVLLDINMPGISGIETCKTISAGSDVAIIMISVRDSEKDKTEALEAGADDYVTKPFSTPELIARIRAALRRKGVTPNALHGCIRIGDVEIDFATRQVKGHGNKERLTPKEFDLIGYLATHPNKVISHRELLQAVWGVDSGEEKEYLRVFVNRLRKNRTGVEQSRILADEAVGRIGCRLHSPE